MEHLEEIFNITTTVNKNNLATSFTNKENYFVSTVNQKNFQSNYPAQFVTLIKKAGMSFDPIITIDSNSAREAAENHIALVRMGTSIDENKWRKLDVDEFMPTAISNMLIHESMSPNNFSNDYCSGLLKAAGINVKGNGRFSVGGFLTGIIILIVITLLFGL